MLRDQLQELLEPAIQAQGCVLWELEFATRPGGNVLRLYIDKPGSPIEGELSDPGSAVTLEDCERVSRAVSEVLDASDPIPSHYDLEVSSPGLDRVLRTAAHFSRYVGESVRVEMKDAVAGRRRFVGRLTDVQDADIAVEVEGNQFRLPLSGIHRARLAPF